MAQSAADIAAQRAAANQNFLANSFETSKIMNAPTGNTYVPGNQLTFTAPILPGWATTIRIFYNLVVTVTNGTGGAVVNAGAPHNLLQNLQVDFSGQNHRNHHAYFLKTLKQMCRQLVDKADFSAWTNAIIKVDPLSAAGANSWIGYMDVPLQINSEDVAGMVPIGESATPLTLRVTCAPSFTGNDPLENPISLTGTASATVTGTVSASVYYRYGQSVHSPAIRPSTPYIGSFAKIVESSTNVASTTNYIITELRQPYPHLQVMQAVVIPTSPTVFSTAANIGGLKFDLDPSTTMQDYSPSGSGIIGKLADQRELYHTDLDQGVYVWDFLSGDNPEAPNGMNTPNIGNYNAAQTEILFNGSLAGSSNRIITAAMFLEPLPY